MKTVVNRTLRPAMRSHWATWVLVAIGLAVALAPMQAVAAVTGIAEIWIPVPEAVTESARQWGQILSYLGWAAVLYGTVAVVGYTWLAHRYYVTPDQITEVYGIIARQRRSTRVAHIRRVEDKQSVIGRILGYGNVQFYSAGSDGVDVEMRKVLNPSAIKTEVQRLTSGEHPEPLAQASASQVDDSTPSNESEEAMRARIEAEVREKMMREQVEREAREQGPHRGESVGRGSGVPIVGTIAANESEALSQAAPEPEPVDDIEAMLGCPWIILDTRLVRLA